ncbi:MAG: transferase hexapeptide repeat family protein [Nocardiopsaceae bacterium]|nr:transferase hexapeptide repeat family protein [Nocardiopsaceae bacterium]
MACYEVHGITPVVHPGAFVHPSAVLIGDVVIEADTYIGPNASLRGDFGSVVVRRGANVQDCCVLHAFPGREVVVEQDGHIGHGAVLHGCLIGEGALVGMNAVVMDGVRVGARAFVGAQSFVRANFTVPEASVAMGNPAEVVRRLSEAEIEWKAKGTHTYQRLAEWSARTMRETEPMPSVEDRRGGGLPEELASNVPIDEFRRTAARPGSAPGGPYSAEERRYGP